MATRTLRTALGALVLAALAAPASAGAVPPECVPLVVPVATTEDTPIPVDLTAQCQDPDQDAITVMPTSPQGTFSGGPTSFTFTPYPNVNGSDTFMFTATAGGDTSAPAVGTISITAVNDAPVAVDDDGAIPSGFTRVVPLPGVLGNDSDVEGNPLTAQIASGPAHGSLTFNSNGTYSYRSNASYSGLDSFTYRAYDGATTSSIATVRITVIPVSAPPPPPPRDTTKPVLSAPAVTLAARTGIHTAVFRSSEAGRATATVYRKRPGRLRNRRCIVPPRNPGSLPRCTRRVRVRIVTRSAVRSTNRVALGRLTPGSYDVDLVVRDAAGNVSRILRRAFVVRAPRVVRR